MGFISGALVGMGGACVGIWVADLLKSITKKYWLSEIIGWLSVIAYIIGTQFAIKRGC